MPRSVGITVSAVLVSIGSVLTILVGAMTVLGSVFLSKPGAAANIPGNLDFFVAIQAIVFFGFGGWGLAAGMGLIHLKQWARISTLVFSTILVFISLAAAVLLAFIPLPNAQDLNLPSNFMSMTRIGMVLPYATFAAQGGFWLYFFSKQSVKAQFQGERSSGESAAPHMPLGTLIAPPSAMQRVRPLSISIIGWSLLICSASTPLVLLFYGPSFPGKQFPVFFTGFFFSGRGASLIFIGWEAVQIVAAIGLLKLKKWGLFSTIGLQCLTVVNAALLVGIPANRARFQQITEMMIASLNAQTHTPVPVPFVFLISIVVASPLAIVFVILWFLITRKQAFNGAAHELARQRS